MAVVNHCIFPGFVAPTAQLIGARAVAGVPLRKARGGWGAAVIFLLTCAAMPADQTPRPYHPQKGSEVLWDSFGVPHIFAKSVPDMFYLFGYAEVEAHGDLLLHVLGGSRGRGAEYFGPGYQDANLKTDRWIWLNEIPARSATWLAQQAPEFRGYLDAFAAGINAAAAAHPEALAPEVQAVLPISALDIIEHEQHFYNFEFVAGRTLMESPPTPAQPSLAKAGPRANGFANAPEDLADGSNGWAIAPSHSSSGKAMLLMNPHLAWGGSRRISKSNSARQGLTFTGPRRSAFPLWVSS